MDSKTSFVRFVVLQKVEDGLQLNSISPFQLDRDLRREVWEVKSVILL